ncbi:hypothetical protein C8J56DRAFT_949794 [Mycena floridula]|nr:hypothetical protein C8J56DRAFT_949794 [Mycena floridula]
MNPTVSACLPEDRRNVAIFLGLHAAGLVLLSIVFLTALLSTTIQRMSTWFMFIFSYMFYCTSFLLLGGHNCDPIPPATLCNIQAALIYASPVLSACSTLSYVLEIFVGLTTHLWRTKVSPTYIIWLRTVPWVVFGFILIEALVFEVEYEVKPNSDHMFCHVATSNVPSNMTSIVILFPLLGVLILQGFISVMLSKHWSAFRKISAKSTDVFSTSALLRLGAFSILMPMTVIILIIASTVQTIKYPDMIPRQGGWNLVVPILPITAALIFGTQKDMLKVWVLHPDPKMVRESGQEPPKGGSSV